MLFLLPETLCAWTVIRAVFVRRPAVRWLDNSAIVRLGDLSYGTYVLHEPLLWLGAAIFAALFGLEALGSHALVASLSLFVVVFPAILGLSAVAYKRIERPFLETGRRLAGRWTLDGRAAA